MSQCHPGDATTIAVSSSANSINLEEIAGNIDRVNLAAWYFILNMPDAKSAIEKMKTVATTWRDAVTSLDAGSGEIRGMESVFEHDDLKRAQAL